MAKDVDNPFRRYVPPRMNPDNGMRLFVYADGSPIMRGDAVRSKGEAFRGCRVIGFDTDRLLVLCASKGAARRLPLDAVERWNGGGGER